ncbi:Uncharacterised protein [Mycobacteroides abscessus subsp. abscessus]|nr:Uncharacterised protein [Mycobacteroides abscessus subsp. abscessus]
MLSSRHSAQHRASITSTNGSATRIVAACSEASPPSSSSTAATADINVPHSTTSHDGGCSDPRLVSEPITSEAESALVTK